LPRFLAAIAGWHAQCSMVIGHSTSEEAMRLAIVGCALGFAVVAAGCAKDTRAEYPDEECRDSVGDDAKEAARVTGQGVEAGVETGVAGVKQAGKATGGLITGGTSKAEREWNEGKQETKQEASEGRQEIAAETRPNCPPR
jgi:hypothetical protein